MQEPVSRTPTRQYSPGSVLASCVCACGAARQAVAISAQRMRPKGLIITCFPKSADGLKAKAMMHGRTKTTGFARAQAIEGAALRRRALGCFVDFRGHFWPQFEVEMMVR